MLGFARAHRPRPAAGPAYEVPAATVGLLGLARGAFLPPREAGAARRVRAALAALAALDA